MRTVRDMDAELRELVRASDAYTKVLRAADQAEELLRHPEPEPAIRTREVHRPMMPLLPQSKR